MNSFVIPLTQPYLSELSLPIPVLSPSTYWYITAVLRPTFLFSFLTVQQKRTAEAARMDSQLWKFTSLFFPLSHSWTYDKNCQWYNTTEEMFTQKLISLNPAHSLNFKGNSCNHVQSYTLILVSNVLFLIFKLEIIKIILHVRIKLSTGLTLSRNSSTHPQSPWKPDAPSEVSLKEKICLGITWIQLLTKHVHSNLGTCFA